MDKDQIISTLNEKLGAEGIKTEAFQRTFSDYIDEYLPAEGTEPDEAYWAKHVKVLKSISGQFSHDVAAQVEEFKKNYKPQATPPVDKGNKGEKSALEKRLEQIETLLKESTANLTRKELTAQAVAKGKSLKVANEAIWEDAVKSVEIGEKDSADDVIAKAKTIYEKQLKRIIGDGAAPYGNTGRTGASKEAEEAAKTKRENFKNKMIRAGKLPKKENQ